MTRKIKLGNRDSKKTFKGLLIISYMPITCEDVKPEGEVMMILATNKREPLIINRFANLGHKEMNRKRLRVAP
jgi:hypothetical protein